MVRFHEEPRLMNLVVKIVLAALASLVVLFVVTGLILPRQWSVTAEVVIHAPAEQIHPHVEDLHQWAIWADRQHPDTTLRYDYSGPDKGVGATRTYHGERAGDGRMTIVKSESDSGVWLESAVNSPTPNAEASITYEAKAGTTKVTWTDRGELPFITGGFLRDAVEQGLKTHLDRGLTQLKELAETGHVTHVRPDSSSTTSGTETAAPPTPSRDAAR